jgi:hypothetical protein
MNAEDSTTRMRFADWIRSNWKVLSTISALLLIVLVPALIYLALPGDELMDLPSSDDFGKALQTSARRSMGSFMWWYKTNIILQITLIAASLAATVAAALTTPQNVEVIKKYSVIFTGLTAAVATAQQTFHVKENINSFITSTWNFELLAYDYASQRAHLTETSVNNEKSDKDKILEIQKDVMQKYVDIESNRMRTWASIGEQSGRAPVSSNPASSGAPAPR